MNVKIGYETKPTAKAGAVQWLDPEQTAGKKQPYLFTQCQVHEIERDGHAWNRDYECNSIPRLSLYIILLSSKLYVENEEN